jgi:hypothetical protein
MKDMYVYKCFRITEFSRHLVIVVDQVGIVALVKLKQFVQKFSIQPYIVELDCSYLKRIQAIKAHVHKTLHTYVMPAKVNFLLVSELETFRWLFS